MRRREEWERRFALLSAEARSCGVSVREAARLVRDAASLVDGAMAAGIAEDDVACEIVSSGRRRVRLFVGDAATVAAAVALERVAKGFQ